MESKVIHATVYDPHGISLFKSKATDRAECKIVNCSNSENCSLFKMGKCILADSMFGRCVYGNRQSFQGPTKRAQACSDWVSDKKDQYKDVLWKMSTAPSKLAVIGEYVYLPYAHMDMNESVPFMQHDKFFQSGMPFVALNSFTTAVVGNIIKFRPRAMNYQEITSYRKEQLPKFALHLKEVMPELYSDAAKVIPELSEIVASSTMVGRKALVHSLKAGTVVTKYHDTDKLPTQHWTWDGEWLTSTDAGPSFGIVSFSKSVTKIKPKAGESVVITNDMQVDENTEYVN